MSVHVLVGALGASVTIGLACDAPRGDTSAGFSAEAALEYARIQLEFGPRVPGSIGHKRAGDWIVTQMQKRADTVIVQEWIHVTRGGDSIPLRNILGQFNPSRRDRILYVAHWDTRPRAEREVSSEGKNQPIFGANDGAAAVGLLIAIADVLEKRPPSVGVDLLFTDGEDFGDFRDPDLRDVLIGSQHLASHLPAAGYAPLFGVVWDMVGGRDLRIRQEGYSVERAPDVVERVWRLARDLGYGSVFEQRVRSPILDDHVPLLEVGLPVIDIIDLDYKYHHTLEDTIDKLSARSLRVAGHVALALLTQQYQAEGFGPR